MRAFLRTGVLTGAALLCLAGATVAAADTPPRVTYVTPGLGTGSGHLFSFAYADDDGAGDLATGEVLIQHGPDIRGEGACYFFTDGQRVWLRDDGHTTWLGPVTAGATGTLRNAQCTLSASAITIAESGTTRTVTLTLSFSAAFAGPTVVNMKATDQGGLSSGWIQAGTWSVAPISPTETILTSTCLDASREADMALDLVRDPRGQNLRYDWTPSCFPRYSDYQFQEGKFLTDHTPVPILGRTCGHFDVLVVFTDTEPNRRKLLDNTFIPDAIKAQVASGAVVEGLRTLFHSYTAADIMSGLRREAASVVSFDFTVALTHTSRGRFEFGNDDGLGFARYDAVLLLDDLTPNAGHGVHRWPSFPDIRPVFLGAGTGVVFNIDPFWLAPGLVGNELLRRNTPTTLAEYQLGPTTLVREGGVTYDRTPIINPRTGENIEPLIRSYEGRTSTFVYLNGWGDVDGDGIIDCVDPVITPTPDNVDGDFVPDRFDPDLGLKHQPYSWRYAPRAPLPR